MSRQHGVLPCLGEDTKGQPIICPLVATNKNSRYEEGKVTEIGSTTGVLEFWQKVGRGQKRSKHQVQAPTGRKVRKSLV